MTRNASATSAGSSARRSLSARAGFTTSMAGFVVALRSSSASRQTYRAAEMKLSFAPRPLRPVARSTASPAMRLARSLNSRFDTSFRSRPANASLRRSR